MARTFNIIEQKKSEDKIEESENWFRTMADASPMLIWATDAKRLSSYYNKTFLDFIGASKEGDISDWTRIVHPLDIYSTLNRINISIAEGLSYSLECRLLRADGQWRWVLSQGNPILGPKNEFMGFVGSSVDITDRKEAEGKVIENEILFRNLVEESTVATAVLEGPEWVLTLANEKMLQIWQRNASIHGKKLLDFMPELVGQPFPNLLKAVYETGITYSEEDALTVLNRGGKLEDVYMDFSYKALRNSNGDVHSILVSAIDVTERYRTRMQLIESEQRFQNLVYSSPSAIGILMGPDLIISTANKAINREANGIISGV